MSDVTPDEATGRLPSSVVPGERRDGPPLAVLLHRLTSCPADLLDPQVHATAAVADLAVALDGTVLDPAWLRHLDERLAPGTPVGRDAAALALLASWLVADPALRGTPGARDAAARAGGTGGWLLRVVDALPRVLAGLRAGPAWLAQDGPREELARAFLAVAGLRPAGEDDDLAADAWAAVSTAHQRVLTAQMAQEQERARELAARLAEQRAKEAAAQYANY
ncbi:hypothetical protein ACFUMH_02050 [Cellulomonas sp. NPDC057328]|uniref:hypothetical protein n=1 Tax=Cellulomonas sp. NPDC057328 TaxID=3346101 RepID=UPI00362D0114